MYYGPMVQKSEAVGGGKLNFLNCTLRKCTGKVKESLQYREEFPDIQEICIENSALYCIIPAVGNSTLVPVSSEKKHLAVQ